MGVLLTALALTPGLVFLTVHEQKFPTRKHSAVREISVFLTVAAVCYVVTILFVLLLSWPIPSLRAGLSALFGQSPPAPADDVWAWLGLLPIAFLASLLAFGLGKTRVIGMQRSGSAWWELFRTKKPPGTVSYASITTINGDRLYGYVQEFSREVNENQNRALVMDTPWVQYVGEEDPQSLGSPFITVHASQISYLTVDYYTVDAEQSDGTDVERLEAHIDAIKNMNLWTRIFKRYPDLD